MRLWHVEDELPLKVALLLQQPRPRPQKKNGVDGVKENASLLLQWWSKAVVAVVVAASSKVKTNQFLPLLRFLHFRSEQQH